MKIFVHLEELENWRNVKLDEVQVVKMILSLNLTLFLADGSYL